MELNKYVRQTLVEVLQGVVNAQEEVREFGGIINPHRTTMELADQLVEFEVEVSTVEGSESESGLGVFAGPLAAGTRAGSDAETTHAGRIQFCVPVRFPMDTES